MLIKLKESQNTSPKNNPETNEEEILRERSIPSEQKNTNDLRLKE